MKANTKRENLIAAEHLIKIWKDIGVKANKLLFDARWQLSSPSWYDHRGHLLDIEKATDNWTLSADLVIRNLPLNGKLLSLCSGDGWYEYNFYSKRASEIICIDINTQAMRLARRIHKKSNIKHILGDILKYDYSKYKNYFDTVSIRGAIEHFTKQEQAKIFKIAHYVLKPKSSFCGDTPAKISKNKLLDAHENEFKNKNDILKISGIFSKTESYTVVSKERTTIFWRCIK